MKDLKHQYFFMQEKVIKQEESKTDKAYKVAKRMNMLKKR